MKLELGIRNVENRAPSLRAEMNGSNVSKQPKYLVLDTWVLAEHTRGRLANNLSNFINGLELTIVIDVHTLIELYNPEWYRIPFIGRTRNVSEFLIDHPPLIVNPEELILSEVRAYPDRLRQLPVATNFQSLHWSVRDYLIKGLFRRDKDLISHGLDLGVWSGYYKKSKDNWPGTVKAIINNSISAGILVQRDDGTIDPVASDKEGFLRSLDQRFLDLDQHRSASRQVLLDIANNIGDLYYGATSQLPALRLTSLSFWHAYVETDKAYPMPPKGSDLGDLYRFALVPYCSHFTVDAAMERVLTRALAELPQTAEIIGPSSLSGFLDTYAPDPGDLLQY